MFIAGTAVDDSPIELRWQIAAWRFIPCVETTIEEKHSRVALSKRRHPLGPVRVSLANRLPLLERRVRREQVSGQKLLDCFARSRSLKSVPSLLNIDGHPLLDKAVGERPASMRATLAKVLYRCDLDREHVHGQPGLREGQPEG